MGNLGSAWVRAAQVGTLCLLFAGCAESEEAAKPDATTEQPDAMTDDCSAQTNERACWETEGCQVAKAYRMDAPDVLAVLICLAEDSCSDGDAATCATNDETGEVALFTTTCVPPGWTAADYTICERGLPACSESRPTQIGACAGPLEPGAEMGRTFTGVVEAIESSTRACPGGGIGNPPSGGGGYAVVISDGEKAISVGVHLPSTSVFANVGDTVTVESELQTSFEAPSQGWLTVHGVDGELLLWVVMTSRGFSGLVMPELAVSGGPATCEREESSCGTVTQSGLVARSGDSGAVEIGWGQRAKVGDYDVLHGDNTTRPSTCIGYAGQYVVFGAARRSAELRCDELGEGTCDHDDRCRAVYARHPGETDTAFITCVADESCGDGDLVTCAVDDESGEPILFTTTCVPPGWTEASEACDLEDAGTEL